MTRWNVIRELPGEAPQVIVPDVSYRDASALVFQVAEASRHRKGTKVYLQQNDSADSLQVSRAGLAVRDQPALPRVGENLTILVPTATGRGVAR